MCSPVCKKKAYIEQHFYYAVLFVLFASSLNAQTSVTAPITVSVTVGAPQASITFLGRASVAFDEPQAPIIMEERQASVTFDEPQSPITLEEWASVNFEENYDFNDSSDYDGDGQFDYYEYYAGTDPKDGASHLKIIETTLSGNDAIITWAPTPTEDGIARKYRVFRSGPDALSILAAADATIENLSANPDITSVESDDGEVEISPKGDEISITDKDVKDDFPLFYRVFLSQPIPVVPR